MPKFETIFRQIKSFILDHSVYAWLVARKGDDFCVTYVHWKHWIEDDAKEAVAHESRRASYGLNEAAAVQRYCHEHGNNRSAVIKHFDLERQMVQQWVKQENAIMAVTTWCRIRQSARGCFMNARLLKLMEYGLVELPDEIEQRERKHLVVHDLAKL